MVALVILLVGGMASQLGWLSGKRPVGNTKEPVSLTTLPRPTPPNQVTSQVLGQQLHAAQAKVAAQGAELDILRLRQGEIVLEALRLSNLLAKATVESEDLRVSAQRALDEAKAEILQRSKRIEFLEGEIGALNHQLRDLSERLGRQDARIAEAERRAATSEAERIALKGTLASLQAERRELEERVRSKEVVLSQVKRLRDEESAARDSLFRRNWLAKSQAKPTEPAANPVPAPSAVGPRKPVKHGIDVSVAQPPKARGPRGVVPPQKGSGARTNNTASGIASSAKR